MVLWQANCVAIAILLFASSGTLAQIEGMKTFEIRLEGTKCS